MFKVMLIWLSKVLIRLRYRVKVEGVDGIKKRGNEKILFLPNHPALIDPVIVFSYLYPSFKQRALGDRDQLGRPVINWLTDIFNIWKIPSVAKQGSAARQEVEGKLQESIDALKEGDNLLLWSAGRLRRSKYERISGTSSVKKIIQEVPELRVVLVRTTGLWGSKFSWAWGKEPKVGGILKRGVWQIFSSGIFFMHKREVEVELIEPVDFPRDADKTEINEYLEEFYNEKVRPNTYVPYSIWDRSPVKQMAEPGEQKKTVKDIEISDSIREIVLEHLQEVSGHSEINENDNLSRDYGLDSIAKAELVIWLEEEFGIGQIQPDDIQTVRDVLLAANGSFVYQQAVELKDVPGNWFDDAIKKRVSLPEGDKITDVFLKQAAANPSRAIAADQATGIRTYRDIVLACLVLQKKLEQLEGDYLGIMMPASVTADILFLATMFAGKTPVMVNWTAGHRVMKHSLDDVGVRYIVTARQVVDRLKQQKVEFDALESEFIYVENIAAEVGKVSKAGAWVESRFNWGRLKKANVRDMAAVLFTSGSETRPKAVGLTHQNILSDLKGVLEFVILKTEDKMVGFLPPFHSFGLTVTVLAPLLGGLRVVYNPNPFESATIAEMLRAYGVSLLMGTPSFLKGILRAADEKQLSSLRLTVTGADKCPESVYEKMNELAEHAKILEGYGVTECSPIISLNDENDPQPMTIGKILPVMDYKIISPEGRQEVERGEKGMLIVSGPNVFGGYLNFTNESAFLEVDGKKWYNTGDLVVEDENSVLTFAGRLKRFVKIGGEMVSLPAIESVLGESFAGEEEVPVLAVLAEEAYERPALVLFCSVEIDRQDANRVIRQAGLSGIHNIQKVVRVEEIPTLATGKTNYRQLKKMLADEK